MNNRTLDYRRPEPGNGCGYTILGMLSGSILSVLWIFCAHRIHALVPGLLGFAAIVAIYALALVGMSFLAWEGRAGRLIGFIMSSAFLLLLVTVCGGFR